MIADEEIQQAVVEVWVAADRVEQLISGRCPGPHRYVQYRDGKPPWCKSCRYTAAGQHVTTGGDR